MKQFMIHTLFFTTLIFSSSVFCLEIDEKLTLRVLKHSSTKKTILINRGLEDGISVGDHAKFFLTTGVIARAVVVKTSPSRSIWSVYRLVDQDQIVADKVMNLKISSPVKLTKDRSKMLSPDPTDTSTEIANIALSPEADDLPKAISNEDKQDLATLAGETAVISDLATGLSKDKTLEIWGLANFSALSSSSTNATGDSNSGSDSSINFSAGLEKYFSDSKSWLYKFSLFGVFHYSSKDFIPLNGAEVRLSAVEYGLGVNWHFLASPFAYNKLIGYATTAIGFGTTQEVFNDPSSAEEAEILEGSSSFVNLGIGAKYYHPKGFGARVLLDFYRRAEQYVFEDADEDSSKVVQGPRMQVGISYRW